MENSVFSVFVWFLPMLREKSRHNKKGTGQCWDTLSGAIYVKGRGISAHQYLLSFFCKPTAKWIKIDIVLNGKWLS